MRILFNAYCMVDNYNGDSLIGVFKRCLRIGLEMKRRGHEVVISCTDYHLYTDAMTRAAEGLIELIDPRSWYTADSEVSNREACCRILRDMKLDLVVIGELPLAGTLLDSAICAVQLGIRLVVLDNAYNTTTSEALCKQHGGIADGIILTGLSTFHPTSPPSYYFAAPPMIENVGTDTRGLLTDMGIDQNRLITVLAYEKKAEELAVSIMKALPELGFHSIFISVDKKRSLSALASLPLALRPNARLISPPADEVLFGLMKASRMIVGKSGFMQATEALAVGTPFIGVFYLGCFGPSLLPPAASRFVHATKSPEADQGTLDAAKSFFRLPAGSLAGLHNGCFSALSKIGAFLEDLPTALRPGTTEESIAQGYTPERMAAALRVLHPQESVFLERIRFCRLRNLQWGTIDQLICHYRQGNTLKSIPLWGVSITAQDDKSRGEAERQRRRRPGRTLYATPGGNFAIEEDLGQSHLPDLEI